MSDSPDTGSNVIALDERRRRAAARMGGRGKEAPKPKPASVQRAIRPPEWVDEPHEAVPFIPWRPLAHTVMLFATLAFMLGVVALCVLGHLTRDAAAGLLAASGGALACLTIQSVIVTLSNPARRGNRPHASAPATSSKEKPHEVRH